MMELKIVNIEIKDEPMNTKEKIDYLRDNKGYEAGAIIERVKNFLPEEKFTQWKNGQALEVIRHYDENKQELVELFEGHPEVLEVVRFPNQTVYITLENKTPIDFKDEEIKEIAESVILDKLNLAGNIDEFGLADKISSNRKRYYTMLAVAEDKKDDNKEICRDIPRILFLKEFAAQTKYGKVISSQIPHQLVDEFHRTSDFYYVITSTLDGASSYFCFSDLGRKVEEYLRNEESISLPQIDFSDYVNALIEIVQNRLFIEICENQYRIKITDWLEDIKKEKYGAVPEGLVEHILRKIAYSVGVSGNGLQNFLDRLTTNDKNRRLFEETKSLIKALARNPRAHGSLERPKTDDRYFTILGMKAIRDIYLDRYFFESLNTCFKEMGKKTGDSFEELWKEYFEGRMYLFSWNDIIGNDSERFIEFLEKDLKINWVKNATIEKADDNKTIEVTDGKHLITFKLNREEKKVTREIPGQKTYGYILKEEGSKLNIYKKGKRGGLLVDYERKENTISFQINFKDKNFSFVVNLPEKQCQGGSIA